MRRSPIKPSQETEAILLRQAQLRLEIRSAEEIARQIGASRAYVQSRLSTLMQQVERQIVVPRGTSERPNVSA